MPTSESVEKLVYAIFLSALKKRVEAIELKWGCDRFVIDFLIDGQRVEELRPPVVLGAPVFEQLELMCGDDGTIHLVIGVESYFFAVTFAEPGAVQRCQIRPVTDESRRQA